MRGESACVNPENYDEEIGTTIAYDNAFKQLWPLFGFMLAEDQMREKGHAQKDSEEKGSDELCEHGKFVAAIAGAMLSRAKKN